jgi:hypothetical protein
MELLNSFDTRDDDLMEIYDAKGAFNTFEFILLNDPTFNRRNINNNSNLLTDSEKQQLANLVQQYDREKT